MTSLDVSKGSKCCGEFCLYLSFTRFNDFYLNMQHLFDKFATNKHPVIGRDLICSIANILHCIDHFERDV